MKQWHVFSIIASADQEEALTALLVEQGFPEMEIETSPSGETLLKVYAEATSDLSSLTKALEKVIEQAAEHFPGEIRPRMAISSLNHEDWAENWKKYFHPFKVRPHLVIRPSWTTYDADPDEIVLVLDPGRAFGTGQHASTALCLEALQKILIRQKNSRKPVQSMLDLGTGTGILAMAAAKMGVPTLLAVDIDEDAVAAALINVSANGLEKQISVQLGALESVSGLFDMVTANLDLETLRKEAWHLRRLLAPTGRLILSGILVDQGGQIEKQYAPLNVLSRRIGGEWLCLELGMDR